jgi:deazaflavin-dependent oxidoreductase (nitroreductase family)
MKKQQNRNEPIVADFRAPGGQVGGEYEGAPLLLLTHRGRRSGRERVTPMMYVPDEADRDTVYVFASRAGAPTSPDWYHNLLASTVAQVERGDASFTVEVRELVGAERDCVYAEPARRFARFGAYCEQVRGHRTIPVLALRRT